MARLGPGVRRMVQPDVAFTASPAEDINVTPFLSQI